jgi:hypothetical protein
MLTGIGLPTVERLRELRGAGENAGDWLVLWMVTAALFVIAPRLLLALGSTLRSATLKRQIRIAYDFYVRRVLRDAVGRARSIRVLPYAFELGAPAKDRLKRLLTEVLGDKTAIETDAGIAYGEEDPWVARNAAKLANADQVILLFNLASTPESENHGALVDQLRNRLKDRVELNVLVDDSQFRHKFRGQASAPRRLEERLHAWRAVLAPSKVEPIQVTLDADADSDAPRLLEQALMQSTAGQ